MKITLDNGKVLGSLDKWNDTVKVPPLNWQGNSGSKLDPSKAVGILAGDVKQNSYVYDDDSQTVQKVVAIESVEHLVRQILNGKDCEDVILEREPEEPEVRAMKPALDFISSVEYNDDEIKGNQKRWWVRYVGGVLSISELDWASDRPPLVTDIKNSFRIGSDINFSKKFRWRAEDIDALLESWRQRIIDWWSEYEDETFVKSYLDKVFNALKSELRSYQTRTESQVSQHDFMLKQVDLFRKADLTDPQVVDLVRSQMVDGEAIRKMTLDVMAHPEKERDAIKTIQDKVKQIRVRQ